MDYVRKYLNVEGVIGQGTFGKVLVTSLIQNQPERGATGGNEDNGSSTKMRFALKCIHPIIKPQRLTSELRFLRDLGGRHNVVPLHSAYFEDGALFIVMDLIEHDRFVDIVPHLNYEEIWSYMKNLLIALEWVHRNDILHRDIKPANFLFNRKNRKFMLVDFGLAQKLKPNSKLDQRSMIIPNSPFVNPRNIQSPAKRLINFSTPPTPVTPNKSTKRVIEPNETNDSIQMLKKLRVSKHEEPKEPVKLTVGAYESPVTHEGSPAGRDNHKFSTPKIPRRQAYVRCDCSGKSRTCGNCMSKPESNVSRSGTPGYKAPEILLRSSMQTTAIDMWSAGVIMICLLSGHSPMFRDTDDTNSLAELISIFGTDRMVQAAFHMGVRLTSRPRYPGYPLKFVCEQTRSHMKTGEIRIPDCAYDLLNLMLEPNPYKRITASAALKHQWLSTSIEEHQYLESHPFRAP